jgi:ribosomal protein S18 acetylase RimI-like enzyme
VDPQRDMSTIVELIAIGFEGELDPQGQKVLTQMRRMARFSSLTSWMMGATDMQFRGFVWVEAGQVVGNLSVRTALPSHRRGMLIGNVVVHPDYRGQGIGRALMESAIDLAHNRSMRWLGLEVREDNAVACGLYHRLGFRTVGRMQHLVRPGGVPWPQRRADDRGWSPSAPGDKLAWNQLASTVYSHRQRRVLETRPGHYAFGGWERKLRLWFEGQRETAWLDTKVKPRLALRVKTDRRHHFHLWTLLVHPRSDAGDVRAVIGRALAMSRRYPPWPTVAMVADWAPLVQRLGRVGFAHHRTLLQMMLELA